MASLVHVSPASSSSVTSSPAHRSLALRSPRADGDGNGNADVDLGLGLDSFFPLTELDFVDTSCTSSSGLGLDSSDDAVNHMIEHGYYGGRQICFRAACELEFEDRAMQLSPEDMSSNGKANGAKRSWDTMGQAPLLENADLNKNSGVEPARFYGSTYGKTSTPGAEEFRRPSSLHRSNLMPLPRPNARRSILQGIENAAVIEASGVQPNNHFKGQSSGQIKPFGDVVLPEKIGFPNTGNTCYLNAVLQCLVALPDFVKSVIEWNRDMDDWKSSDGDKENEGKKYPILRATHKLINCKLSGRQHDVGDALTCLREAFAAVHPKFGSFDQHDAQEFLLLYFEDLQKEAVEFAQVKSKKTAKEEDTKDDSDAWETFEEETELELGADIVADASAVKKLLAEDLPTPVTSNFFFRTRTTRACGKCHKSTVSLSDNLILPLQLQDGDSRDFNLQNLLRRALSTKLERTCDGCNEKLTDSSSEERMANLPRHLLLLLPRAYFSKEAKAALKSKTRVEIPPVLQLTKFVEDQADGVFKYVDLGRRKKSVARKRSADGLVIDQVQPQLMDLRLNLSSSNRYNDSLNDEEALKVALENSMNDPFAIGESDRSSSPTNLFSSSCEVDNVSSSALGDTPSSTMSSDVPSNSSFDIVVDPSTGKHVSVNHLTEEQMLEIAVRNSLETATPSSADVVPQTDGGLTTPPPETVTPPKRARLDERWENMETGGSTSPVPDTDAATLLLNPDHEYRLTGVVSHLGDSAARGHYVADILAKQRWRRYNDLHIGSLATYEMLESSAVNGYLFFYTHDAYCDQAVGRGNSPDGGKFATSESGRKTPIGR